METACSTKDLSYKSAYGIENLPDEVIQILWQYLSARDVLVASQVCQRWNRLAADRALLVRRYKDVQRARPSLRILFVTARFTKPSDLLLITRNLHTLITHERVPLNDDDVKLLSELPHLRHLDIFTSADDINTLESNLYAVYKQLNTLVLNEPVVSPTVWHDLVKYSNLTQLHMYGRIWLYPPGAIPLLLAQRRQQFTELTLRCKEVSDSGYLAISQCPNLVVLRLYTCFLLRERAAVRLTVLSKLRVLHITGAHMVRTKPLFQLIKALPTGIQELALCGTYFTDIHAKALAKRLPHLRVLELWGTRAVRILTEKLVDLAMNLQELWEFDIDKQLRIDLLVILSTHPTLQRLRCARPFDVSMSEFNVAAGRLAPVSTPEMRYGRGSLRSDGEGWRSSIYYHWLTDRPPIPLPSDTPPPGFVNDFEDDYSLLGPDPPENVPSKLPETSSDTIIVNQEEAKHSFLKFGPQIVNIHEYIMRKKNE
ncbi:hypothetical protein O0L34_g11713 [Tuta absoluta]|nr:hypothetical protein O0L34_g11713 [Tuta absoluta]